MADLGWSRHIADLEDAHEAACYETAIKNGHTTEEADNCEVGAEICPDCPYIEGVE